MVNRVWRRVNWNAKNSKGEYVCREKPCYSTEMVRDTLIALSSVVDEKTFLANNQISTFANEIVKQGSKESAGRIAAVLHEYRNAMLTPTEKQPDDKKGTNWTYIGIGAGVLALAVIFYASSK